MVSLIPSLEELHERLSAARRAEEVFGTLGDDPARKLREAFLRLVRIAHPDCAVGDKALAQRTFELLMRWRDAAHERIVRGTYGTTGTLIQTPRGTYHIYEAQTAGDYATLHACDGEKGPGLTFKIARGPRDNPLAETEVLTLTELQGVPGAAYFPRLIDALLADDGTARRRAVIYGTGDARHTLADVRAAYPAGIDPRDAAWMFNRLLEALYFTHRAGFVHGAILPANVRIDLQRHGLVLTEWAYAVRQGEALTAISAAHEAWYPREVFAREPATPALDIYLAARCLVHLLGGEVTGNDIQPPRGDTLPPPYRQFLRACLLPAARRPQDAGALRADFDGLLESLYGKRTFRPFAMPT